MSHRKFALVPAYEPGKALTPLVRSLLLRGFAVIVVDDGSKEAYRRIFQAVLRRRPLCFRIRETEEKDMP